MPHQSSCIVAHVAPLSFHCTILSGGIWHDGSVACLDIVSNVRCDIRSQMRLSIICVDVSDHHMAAARIVDELFESPKDLLFSLIRQQHNVIEFGHMIMKPHHLALATMDMWHTHVVHIKADQIPRLFDHWRMKVRRYIVCFGLETVVTRSAIA